MNTDQKDITIDQKIVSLKTFLDNTKDEKIINKFYKLYNKFQNTKIEKTKNIELDKNSYKYIVFLKILNLILVENNMNKINDIYEFKNMTKDHLIKNKDANILFNLEKDVFKKGVGFSKHTCHWYYRSVIDNYIISFIKGACEQLGITLNCKYNKKAVDNKIVNYVTYTIKSI